MSSKKVLSSATTMSNNLFDDVDSMLEVSTLIYFFASLKKLSGLEDPDFADSLPKTSYEVFEWVKKNSHLIKTDDLDRSFLEDIIKRDNLHPSKNATLEVLDDDFAFAGGNSEIVYGIAKNPDKKRISVIFRGSSNAKDWAQNFKFGGKEVTLNPEEVQREIPNANLQLLGEFKHVHIHSGFYAYLLEHYSKEEDGQETDKVKFTEIMNHIMNLVKENPDYELWFSGHSLGGALATLVATCAAISDDIKKPIKLISIASPQVGKSNYVKAMNKLQDSRKLLHVRVTNNNDLVPQLLGPFGYHHFGLHLNFFKTGWNTKKTHSLSFNQGGMSRPWLRQIGYNHKCGTYYKRLMKAKSELEKQDFDVFDALKE